LPDKLHLGTKIMQKYFHNCKIEKESIDKRYRSLAKKYHPDKAKGDAEYERLTMIMRDINEEHKEMLVLLKYKSLNTDCEEEIIEEIPQKRSIGERLQETFNLSDEQVSSLAEQGKTMFLSFMSAVIDSNLKRQ
jgi:regulator of sigma D